MSTGASTDISTPARYRPNAGLVLFQRQPAGQPSRVFVGRRFGKLAFPWQLPQGGVDPGEDVRAAALRELTEETGVPASAVSIAGESDDWLTYNFPQELKQRLFKNKYDGQRQKWFALELDPALGDDVINIRTAEPEFMAWKWIPFADALGLAVPFKRPVYAQVYKELGGIVG